MTASTYMGLYKEPTNTEVQGFGSAFNDGWQIVARLPRDLLPSGSTKRMAIYVRGVMTDPTYQGPNLPQRGLMQVCLGSDAGLRGQVHRVNLGIREHYTAIFRPSDGVQFAFLMVQQAASGSEAAIVDQDFGATMNTGASDLVLWARSAWNGDTPAYAGTFKVADVQWLWIDMDAMQANDHVHADVGTPLTLLDGAASVQTLVASSRTQNADEMWLTIANVIQRPYALGYQGATLQCGHTADGVRGEWSQSRAMLHNNGLEQVRCSMGMFFYTEGAGGGQTPYVKGWDNALLGPPFNTQVLRAVMLNVRVDVLTDFHYQWLDYDTITNGAPTWVHPDETTVFQQLERPASLLSLSPVLLLQESWSAGPTVAESAHLRCKRHDSASHLHIPGAYCWADKTLGEVVPVQSMLQVSMPAQSAMQFDNYLFVRTNSNHYRNVRFPQILMLHPVYDPDAANSPPWVEPAAVWLQVGREGVPTTSLDYLPIAPDAQLQQTTQGARVLSLRTKVGYSRSWPLFRKARRVWRARWSALSRSDADTLMAFLAANKSFKMPKPYGLRGDLPVVQSGNVTRSDDGAGIVTIEVTIVELIYVL